MFPLSVGQRADLLPWFLPDQPGPLVGLHVLKTGVGVCFVDRLTQPRAVLVGTAGTYALLGEPDVLTPGELQACIAVGSIDASERFEGLVRAAFPKLIPWPRLIMELSTRPERIDPPTGAIVRQLDRADGAEVTTLDSELEWIAGTWGGPVGLAASGYAWGAFLHDRLVSVASSFFVGENYEDLGVVTAAAYRGLGLSTACAAALCGDILERGRRPCWTTPTDNLPSMRVAEKLGFVVQRSHRLFLVGLPAPELVH